MLNLLLEEPLQMLELDSKIIKKLNLSNIYSSRFMAFKKKKPKRIKFYRWRNKTNQNKTTIK